MKVTNNENKNTFFEKYASEITESERIITTPSNFAKNNLFYLQEIGKLKSLKKHESRRNTLDSFLIVLIINGKGFFRQNGNEYLIKSGDVLFLNCKYSYSQVSDEYDPWTLLWIHFKGPNLEEYHNFFKQKFNSIHTSTFNNKVIFNLMNNLKENAEIKQVETEFSISNLISALLTEIMIIDKNKIGRGKKRKIDEVKNYIDKNFKKKITLTHLSEFFYISKYHMSREFKNEYGVTINNYITIRKITYCKKLLRFSDLSVEQIGTKAGIGDNSYFNKVFKKVEEITPSEYRKIWTGR